MAMKTKEELITFTKGYTLGIKTAEAMFKQTLKKNYIIRKWVWWLTVVAALTSDVVLTLHLFRENF
jgi:hypothetical protein